jgi:hypothetical protein
MAYTLDFAINLGASQTGLVLKAQLVNTSGANVGSEITTTFTEIGFGQYLGHLTGIPDGHRGGVIFYTGSLPSGFKAFAAINPEEAENSDVKTSSVEGGGGGSDALQRTDAIRVSDQQKDSDDIYLTIGDSYSTDNGRAHHFLDVKSLWPDLDEGTVKFYAQDSIIDATVVTATGNNKEIKVELTSEDTADLAVGKSRYSVRHILAQVDPTPDDVETLAQGRLICKENA